MLAAGIAAVTVWQCSCTGSPRRVVLSELLSAEDAVAELRTGLAHAANVLQCRVAASLSAGAAADGQRGRYFPDTVGDLPPHLRRPLNPLLRHATVHNLRSPLLSSRARKVRCLSFS